MVQNHIKFKQGVVFAKQEEFEKAVVCFSEVLQLFPDNPYVLSERGVAYFHWNKNTNAILDMDAAVIAEPNNPYRYASRAYIRGAIGDVRGAILDYEKAIELDPEDTISHNNLGLLHEKLGYQEKAKLNFKKAAVADVLFKQKKEPKIANFVSIPKTGTSPVVSKEIVSFKSVLKTVFSSKSGFLEFVSFLKNGMKLK